MPIPFLEMRGLETLSSIVPPAGAAVSSGKVSMGDGFRRRYKLDLDTGPNARCALSSL